MRRARRLAGLCLLVGAGLAPVPSRAAEAFVTAQNSDTVDVVDLDARKVVATIPVKGAPAGIALSPDGAPSTSPRRRARRWW